MAAADGWCSVLVDLSAAFDMFEVTEGLGCDIWHSFKAVHILSVRQEVLRYY